MERGAAAGIIVGSGVWMSDFMIIGLCYTFIKTVTRTVQNETIHLWMCVAGGIILMGFGIGSFFTKVKLDTEKRKITAKSFVGYWLKGFLVNTVNPFSFIFWISVITSQVITKNMTNSDAMLFFGAIMVTIIITDLMKVFGAKALRTRLKPEHLQIFGKVAGVGLFAFGVYLLNSGI